MTESSEHISRVLDRCVQQLEQGATVDECLARNPAHRAELAELLPTVAGLRRAPRVTLSPDSVREGRRHLLERLEPRPRPRWSLRSALPLGWRQGGQPQFAARRLTMAWMLVIATVVSLMAGGGVVYASDAAVPGDFLYSLDRAVEDVRLSLTSDGEAAFALQLSMAQERLDEANQLYAAGDTANAKTALSGYSDALIGAAQQMTKTANAQGDTVRAQELTGAAEGLNNVGVEVQIRDRDRIQYCPTDVVNEVYHPVAFEIAEMYDYDVLDVNNWFCDGASLGDIMIAINISVQTGELVDDILNLVSVEELGTGNGKSWGAVLQYYELIGSDGELQQQAAPVNPGQPDDTGPWKDPAMGPGEGEPNQGGQPAGAGSDVVQPGGQQGQGTGSQSGGATGGNGSNGSGGQGSGN